MALNSIKLYNLLVSQYIISSITLKLTYSIALCLISPQIVMLLMIQVSLREMKLKFDFLNIIQILVGYCYTKFLHLYLHYKNIEGDVTPT